MMDILKTNVVDRLTREFEDEGFALIIEEAVLKRIVSESLRRETGARGLASVLTRHIEDAAFETFAEAPGGEIRVSLDGDDIKVEAATAKIS